MYLLLSYFQVPYVGFWVKGCFDLMVRFQGFSQLFMRFLLLPRSDMPKTE